MGSPSPHCRRLSGLVAVVVLCGFPCLCAAVELGGVSVPKQQLVVYLLIGHSNMAGWSEIADHATHPRAWHFELPQQQWVPAVAPMNPEVQGDGSHGGPGMPFLKEMVRRYPQHHIGVLQNAAASATLRWKLNGRSEMRYTRGVPLYDTTISAAKAVQQHATLGGILCMVGWVESISAWGGNTNPDGEYAKSFAADAQNMVTSMRADLGLSDLPFLIGKYQEGASKEHAYRDIVIAEIAKIPAIVPVSAVIDSEGPYVDVHHYDYAGQVKWGKTAAKLIGDNDWFPAAQLSLRKRAITFSAVDGKAGPSAQSIAVANAGKTVMAPVSTEIVYGTASGWLTVTASGQGNSQTLTNTVAVAGLAPNTYSALVKLSAAGALNNPQSYAVSLTVDDKPATTTKPILELIPSVLPLEASEAEPGPPVKPVGVSNAGHGSLDSVTTSITYLNGSGWLTTSTKGLGNDQLVESQVDATGLPLGVYGANVAVWSANADNSPQNYSVTLNVVAALDAGPADSQPGVPDGGLAGVAAPAQDVVAGHDQMLVGGCALASDGDAHQQAYLYAWVVAWLLWVRIWRGQR